MAEDNGIHLADRCDRFVQQQLREGRFASPSAVVEAALLLLEERESRRAQLLEALEQAERASVERTRVT